MYSIPPAAPPEFIKVSSLHTVAYTVYGNPTGKPVLFIHGGPGGGTSPIDCQYFDPAFYRIILVDQRGSGKSTPNAELEENNTWELIKDFEKIRAKLEIRKWLLFGGSWGSTLALLYAQKHPEIVVGLILRGIFLIRKVEIDWYYQEGASFIFPDLWDAYKKPIPEEERGDYVKAYYKRLTGADEKTKLACAMAWSTWEKMTSTLEAPHADKLGDLQRAEWYLPFARIECHYFTNCAWIRDGQILEKQEIDKIRNIPAVIIQGRYDVVCPMKSAWDLHQAWPEAKFHVTTSGHSAREPLTAQKLCESADEFKSLSWT